MEIKKELSIILYRKDIENIILDHFKEKNIHITSFSDFSNDEIFASLKAISYQDHKLNANRGYIDVGNNIPYYE